MIYDPAMGATLLYGGNTYGALYGDTWAYSNVHGWVQLAPASSPPPLQGASLAYDPITQTAVLFGGNPFRIGGSGNTTNQTWTWDGATWSQQFPPVSPPARAWNATNGMVFDSHLGRIVLFGGYTSQFVMRDDTWEWDGKTATWQQRFPAHSPSARVATLAYDESAKQVVLFGGWTNGLAYNDTWTYDGVDWTQQSPATVPPARADNGLAYHPSINHVVLFGGLAGPCEDCGEPRLNDTWFWNGANWNQVQTASTPPPASGVSFAYDGNTNRLLLFGGWVSDFQFTNSTWVFGVFKNGAAFSTAP
jgi:putative ATP-grasp target RiPP